MAWDKFNQTITIERQSQYGVYANGEWFNKSKFGKFDLKALAIGQSYEIEGSLAPEKDGKRQKFIDSYKPHGAAAPVAPPPPVGGTVSHPPAAAPAVDYVKKEDQRTASIVTQAIIKSLLESPILPVLVTDSLSLRRVVEEEARYFLDMHDRIAAERGK